MCGRFAIHQSPMIWAEYFAIVDGQDDWVGLGPRYNVAPTLPVPCFRQDTGRIAFTAKWGLIPSWSKDAKFASNCSNARGDTVNSKPSFRSAYSKRRCIVIADGFYEWDQLSPLAKGEKKQPYYFTRSDGHPLAFAGLWETWEPAPIQPPVVTCTIITTDANKIMAKIHDRLPVILSQDKIDIWLNPTVDPKTLKELLVPCDSEGLQQWAVSKAVNNSRNESPALIVPV